MDVPYDPACPLVIDSDEESIEDEILGKKAQQKQQVSRIDFGLDMQLKASKSSLNKKPKEKSDSRFVPAFEDDNEELLTYCLRESGFLTDDEDVSAKMKTEDNIESIAVKEVDKNKIEDAEYKKKRKKERHKEVSKSRKSSSSSKQSASGSDESENEKERSRKPSHGGSKREEKSFVVVKEKKKSRRPSSSDHESDNSVQAESNEDDIDMLAVKELEEELCDFPLSKASNATPDNKEHRSQKHKSVRKDGKRVKENSSEKHEKSLRKDSDEKHRHKEKTKKRKRKRSKSSHKRSPSSDAEPEGKKKRKSRHREQSRERTSGKKYEEEKDEQLKHKRKHRHLTEDVERKGKEKKSKKKDKDYTKDVEQARSRSRDKEDKERKYSTSSHNTKKRHHSDRSISEKSKRKEAESNTKSKTEHDKKERIHSEHKKERHHYGKGEKRVRDEVKDEKKEHTKQKGPSSKIHDTHVLREKLDVVRSHSTVVKKEKANKEEGTEKRQIDVKLQKEEDLKEEIVGSDTDSEFERLSDREKDDEKDNNAEGDVISDKVIPTLESSPKGGKSAVSKSPDSLEKDFDENANSENLDKSNSVLEDNELHVSEEERGLEDENIVKPDKDLNDKSYEADTTDNKAENNQLPKNELNDVKVGKEKRLFKLLSQEETQKLKEELLIKGEDIVLSQKVSDDKEETQESDKEEHDDNHEKDEEVKVDVEEEKSSLVVEEKDQEKAADEGKEKKNLQKSKDDLFDDIFAQEDDSEEKENDGFAKMLGKNEETSPKRLVFRNQSSLHTKEEKVPIDEKKKGSSPRKTPKLKLEDGHFVGKKSKSPSDTKMRSPGEMLIPGLEPVTIPGLEMISNKEKPTESAIPLLFDRETSDEKGGIPKTPEFSPSKEIETKRKQPYTPPEEFSGAGMEAEINQTDSYYHLEAEDSPYNPEDLTLMDIGLSPVDAKNLQQDALKGAVEMRLKEPFSGYENPTWQKIIEAKSRHEVKRQSRRSDEKQNTKGFSKPPSSKQQKMVDMLVRQSRVEQECKEVLKLYYKSKEITKDEYKSILRKAVPQVTMSNSPIIPEKIRSLMKKFVCKCKGQRLMPGKERREKSKPKGRSSSSQSISQSLTFPGEKRFRYLNPDLPMPPL